MATPPRLFEDGAFYHVYNRGNHKQQIFFEKRDYERFLEKAKLYQEKYPLKIIAYCLMPNHFHFLVQQLAPNALSQFFSDLCNSHSRYFNIKYEAVGHLYQGRFKAKKVEKDEYLIYLSAYIHLNPVDLFAFLPKDELMTQLRLYHWSSLAIFLSKINDDLVDPSPVLNFFLSQITNTSYQDFIKANIKIKVHPLIDHLVFDDDQESRPLGS
jgi:putative transposase